MNLNQPRFSDPEFNLYAPPKAASSEGIFATQVSAPSRARCITSWLLGSGSIILSLLELGFFTFLFILYGPPRGGRMRLEQLAVLFGWFGLATVLGCLGLWLVRAQLRAGRSTSLGGSAARFCVAALVAAVCDAIFVSLLTIYTWHP